MRLGRSKYWWIWPDFNDAEYAQDGANMGVFACAFIAGATALVSIYGYFINGTIVIDRFQGDMVIVLITIIQGYGIFRMSRIASSTALVLFLADKIYSSMVYHKSWGIGLILVWYLIQANRAIFWFRKEPREMPERKNISSIELVKGGKRCPICGKINPLSARVCDCGNNIEQ